MQVRVLFFGILRELVQSPERLLDLPEQASVNDLLALCQAQTSKQSEIWMRLAVAVNREYAVRSHMLHEGDEVALLPPVSGGLGRGPVGDQ